MASIQRRGGVWRAQVARAGQRVNATFDTRAAAEAWAVQTEAAILAGVRKADIDHGPAVQTVAWLFDRYRTEVSPSKRGARWEALRLLALARDPAFGGPLTALDGSALAQWRDRRLRTVSAGTVNRELTLISAVMARARKEWRLGGAVNPVHDVQRPRNPPARSTRISDAERDRLLEALRWDGQSAPRTAAQWTGYAFCLALETAMRKGELLGLVWGHVHLEERWVHLPMTKNGHPRDVPLAPAAIRLFRLLPGGTGKVIQVGSGTLDQMMRRARLATGLMALRFHDARREATTRLAPQLGNVLDLAAVTGHRDLKVLQGYYRPTARDLAKKLT